MKLRKYPCYSWREEIAHHEAGHAVIALKLGLTVNHVTLHNYANGVCNVATYRDYDDAIVSFAGPIAGLLYQPRNGKEWWLAFGYVIGNDGTMMVRNGSDADQIDTLLAELYGPNDKGIWWELHAEAKTAVDLSWPQIQNVAKALLERGKLSSEDEIVTAMLYGTGKGLPAPISYRDTDGIGAMKGTTHDNEAR
jgi:hypothetical protein